MKKRVRRSTSRFVQDQGGYPMTKGKKTKAGNKLVDRISVLPNEILVSILSLLPLKEAQATSVLSRRWRHVWASITTLNFDSFPTISSMVCRSISSEVYNLKSEVEDEISRFIPWINGVVEQHNVPRIEQFRVCSHLNHDSASSIDKWIQFAMEKGVGTLELDFSVLGCVRPMYTFPHDLFKHLCDGHVPIRGPCACIGLKYLRVLSFNCVDVAGEVLEYLLFNCLVLERLLVRDSPSLNNLRVVGSSVSLKFLLIEYCRNVKSIEVRDANLVSLIYDGDCRNLLLKNVPLLVEVSINMHAHKDRIQVAFTQLSCCLSQLKILKLDNLGTYEPDRVHHYNKDFMFPVLASLKHLQLSVYTEDDWILLQLTSFPNASPHLQSLLVVLEPPFPWIRETKYKAARCSHRRLRVVQLVAYDVVLYDASACHLEVVKYLIESAVELEKIIITPNCSGQSKKDIEQEVKKAKARNHSRQQLLERAPLTIAFAEFEQHVEMRSEFVCLY